MKPQLFYFRDHMLFLTDTEPSSSHRHLASHLIFSLEGETEWNIDGEQINCRGIYIDANAEHIGKGGGKFLSLLFVKTSSYAHTMEKKFLQGKSYFILDEKTVEDVVELVNQQFEDPEILNRRILETCMVTDLEKPMYDERVQKTITMIEMKETIDSNTIAELSRHVCLSQSRLSHLFKAETKMSLAGYLAFEKLRKTYCYLMQGESITASCMKAGFDTPSHCAATCRKMFGLSLSKLKK